MQQSPQTLSVYLERQKKYHDENIETFWIIFFSGYITISKAIGQYLLKNKFNNKVPETGIFPSLNNLLVLCLDKEDYLVKGVGWFVQPLY